MRPPSCGKVRAWKICDLRGRVARVCRLETLVTPLMSIAGAERTPRDEDACPPQRSHTVRSICQATLHGQCDPVE